MGPTEKAALAPPPRRGDRLPPVRLVWVLAHAIASKTPAFGGGTTRAGSGARTQKAHESAILPPKGAVGSIRHSGTSVFVRERGPRRHPGVALLGAAAMREQQRRRDNAPEKLEFALWMMATAAHVLRLY